MKYQTLLSILLCLVTTSAFADCSPHKVARNAAMKATVGVSGHCTPKHAAKDAVNNSDINHQPEHRIGNTR